MLDVCLPGTGGMMPLPERWLACCWIECQGKALLIDCGEGTQIALRKAGCKLSRLDALLITHFHADHTAGLPGLLLTLGNNDKRTPLTIIGPKHLKTVISSLMIIAPALPYPVELIELQENTSGTLEDRNITVSYLPLDHAIPCFGYRIDLSRKPIFNPEKAQRLGIPKKHYKTLHSGRPVLLDDGRRIEPAMVLDGARRPISVTYITDSVPTASMADFARGTDLLVCEGMYGDTEMRGKMEEKGHMIFADAARLAKTAGAGRLWLTHFSPALRDPQAYIDNARDQFPAAEPGYDGIRTTL